MHYLVRVWLYALRSECVYECVYVCMSVYTCVLGDSIREYVYKYVSYDIYTYESVSIS